MNKNTFEPFQSIKGFGWTINFPAKELKELVPIVESFYSEWSEPKLNPDKTPKIKNSKIQTRDFSSTSGKLKRVQKQIDVKILKKIPLNKYVLGGVSPYKNRDNSELHKGKKYHFQTDILNFYPSISNRRVFDIFLSLGFSPPVSALITKLTTFKGHLPQGTPTSSTIANLVFSPNDEEIIKITQKNNITYSRWVDDLNFSSQSEFHLLIPHIIDVIHKNGFRINYRKTRYKIGPIVITGIITKNNTLLVPDALYERFKDKSLSVDTRKGLKNYIDGVQGGFE